MKINKLMKKAWLKRMMHILIITALVVAVLWFVFFPNLSGVKTTGEYPYSSSVLELVDESRVEGFKDDGSFRMLSVLVYYPESDIIKSGSAPLVVFSHGGISFNTSNESLYKELASHGYVVASIDHTYHALWTKIDGKRVFIDSG
jgi:hypothetical protein